jgi:peptide/nickel transport system substrate-binding protein
VLQRDAARRGYAIQDAGAGFEFSYLFFNLNDSASNKVWRRPGFRKAVAAAIDREAMVRLVYKGYASPLATPVAAGNSSWIPAGLARPVRSLERARELLKAEGFRWARDGSLQGPDGQNVAFSILTGSTNPERTQMATLIQDDLRPLGIQVSVVPLEFRSLLDRVLTARSFDAAILAMSHADADPNADMNFWLSSGTQHVWNPEQSKPGTPWETEIDSLMRKQLVTRKQEERKRFFVRVQEIAMEQLPLVPLISPNILVGAKKNLGNFRPALLEPYALWNVEELCWQGSGSGAR